MWIVRTLTLIVAGSLLSGCAMGRGRQDLARLQSQVGLLDERVSQLERGSVGGPSSASTGAIAPDFGATTLGASRASSRSAKQSSGATLAADASTPGTPSTREIQEALKNAGFYQGSVDGKMGPLTREAIKEFQRVHGLVDDGVAGRQTWAKLNAYATLSSTDTKK